ncbi:hypothetical protein GCK32_014157 [Trichostrongylus colubriformis]|uniref:Uncharacterized protein n=1 Tax=Trichostrongylus colubriformis TaxID=6319 RepID=A0AAN8J1E0_TRICO
MSHPVTPTPAVNYSSSLSLEDIIRALYTKCYMH